MSYFVGEDNKLDELISFFDGMRIKWKIRPLDNGYSMISAKMGIVDRILYRALFTEMRKESWSRLKTI